MKRMFDAVAVVLLSAVGAGAEAPIDWSSLPDPSAQTFDDPYRDLDVAQITRLRDYAAAAQAIGAGGLSAEALSEARAARDAIASEFAAAGIDPDWLISQRWTVAERREAAATRGNAALDGGEATLVGYAIPAPPDPDGTATVYLVEARGMCSHMPPPPPNRLVRARLADGWQPKTLYQPVRLSGRLSLVPSERVIRVVDGPVQMRASWQLDATATDPATDPVGPNSGSLASEGLTGAPWIEDLRTRYRESQNDMD